MVSVMLETPDIDLSDIPDEVLDPCSAIDLPTTFDDFEEEVDDSAAIDAYAEALTTAVADLGVTVREPGTNDAEGRTEGDL